MPDRLGLHPARQLIAFALLVAGALALTGWLAVRWTSAEALRSAEGQAAQGAKNAASLTTSELQKFSLLPVVLAEYPTVEAALRYRSAGPALNSTLEVLANRTHAAAIFAIRRDGLTVAASNWRLPTSFIGQNYRFRDYFRDAMRRGSGDFFALGTISHRPGLYLARRVERGGEVLGVVVLKVEFGALERLWNVGDTATVIANRQRIVVISSRDAYRFRTLAPLAAAERRAIERSGQFPGIRLLPLPTDRPAANALTFVITGLHPQSFVQASEPLPFGWTLYHWQPLKPALAAAWTRALVALLSVLIVLTVAAGLLLRSRERQRIHAQARAELKNQVTQRTSELSDANEQLRLTSAEREALGERFRAAREELAQANRLGSLGQITAGVAHEINQPAAAIRSYAENGVAFLRQGDQDTARENLARIVQLADRIGGITGELRTFARRQLSEPRPIALGEAMDGTLLLMSDALRLARVELRYDARALGLIEVMGDKVRLEQIIINLAQNAVDAIGEGGGWIDVSTRLGWRWIDLIVTDSGPGVPDSVRSTLFSPFVTSKPRGLGLGLGIARDIARTFGGDLLHECSGSADRFILRLPHHG